MLESNSEYDWWCSWPTGKDEHLADKTVTEDGIDYSYNNLGFRGSAFHGTSGIAVSYKHLNLPTIELV